jgi:hypothetical protein
VLEPFERLEGVRIRVGSVVVDENGRAAVQKMLEKAFEGHG